MPRPVVVILPLVALALLAGCTEPTSTPQPPEAPATSPYGQGIAGASQTQAEDAPEGLAPDLAIHDGNVTPTRFPLTANESTVLVIWNSDDTVWYLAVPEWGLVKVLPGQYTSYALVKPLNTGEIPYHVQSADGEIMSRAAFVVRPAAVGGPGAPVGGLVGPGPANKTLEEQEVGRDVQQPAWIGRSLGWNILMREAFA